MKLLERDYRMPDPALKFKCDDVLDSMDRDIAEFSLRGFTPAKRTDFENRILAFDALPTDNEMEALKEIQTANKNNKREILTTQINTILTMVENVFGYDTPEYHYFTEDASLSHLTDNELYWLAKDVINGGNRFMAELAPEGLTPAVIADLITARDDYDAALIELHKAEKERSLAANTRIRAGNELYALLVKYCNTGKDIWYNVNEAKYNDYVIYDTSNGGTPEPQITIAMASKQNPPAPVNIGVTGTNNKEVTANYGDTTTETKTVNETTPTVFSHLHSSIGNYSMQLIGAIVAFWTVYAPDCNISAINLPEGIMLRALDLMNNMLTSFFLPLSCVDMLSIQLNNNELDQQSVNQVLMQLAANGQFNGSVNLGGGTNAAPSGQGNCSYEPVDSNEDGT